MHILEQQLYRVYREEIPVTRVPAQAECADISTLAKRYQTFLFDGFGTLYLHDRVFDGAAGILAFLRERQRSVRLVTNAASRSPNDLSRHLAAMGIAFAEEEIICSGDLLSQTAQDLKIRQAFHVGYPSAEYFLRKAEIISNPIGDPRFEKNPHERPVVILSSALPEHHPAMSWAVTLLERPHALLIVLNPDAMAPRPDGTRIPVSGIRAMLWQRQTGCAVIYKGKPFPDIFDAALKSLPRKTDVVFIGDTPGTDLVGALSLGIDCALILTGNATRETWLDECRNLGVMPHWIIPRL